VDLEVQDCNMKLNIVVTVNREEELFEKCLPFLFQSISRTYSKNAVNTKVYILVDSTEESTLVSYMSKISNFCEQYIHNVQIHSTKLNGDFSNFRNYIHKFINDGEYIFQIDADEFINEDFLVMLFELYNITIENHESFPELIRIPRINIVDGITTEHIHKWRWYQNENGFINYPDYQGRIYIKSPEIQWVGKVHERIEGHKTVSHLKTMDGHLFHIKSIHRQEKQNEFYDRLG
jgi:hypothetical protein